MYRRVSLFGRGKENQQNPGAKLYLRTVICDCVLLRFALRKAGERVHLLERCLPIMGWSLCESAHVKVPHLAQ